MSRLKYFPNFIIGKGNERKMRNIEKHLAVLELRLIMKYGQLAYCDSRGYE
jgi:hypothetical protein